MLDTFDMILDDFRGWALRKSAKEFGNCLLNDSTAYTQIKWRRNKTQTFHIFLKDCLQISKRINFKKKYIFIWNKTEETDVISKSKVNSFWAINSSSWRQT